MANDFIFHLTDEELEKIEEKARTNDGDLGFDHAMAIIGELRNARAALAGLPMTATLHGTLEVERMWGFYRNMRVTLTIRLLAEKCEFKDEDLERIRMDTLEAFTKMLDVEFENFRLEVEARKTLGPAAAARFN